jgi:flavorubredoxin
VCTKKGAEGLSKHYQRDWNFKVVKTGDALSLGGKTLSFVETPMMHWPDSMVTYVPENKVLLSNDAFGQHIATNKRFDEDVGVELALSAAREYYANILMPLGSIISKKLADVQSLGIQIDIIAPSHGVIWKNPEKIIEAYTRWSSSEVIEKILIVYDTMWGSTEKMAKAILEGITREGVVAELLHLRRNPRSKIVNKMLDASAIIVGSPTLNMGMYPTVGDFLTYITGLKPKNKHWAAFGSYGWSGGAVRDIKKALEDAGFNTHENSLEIQYVPEPKELDECIEFGRNIARQIKER